MSPWSRLALGAGGLCMALAGAAGAETSSEVCYDYGCARHARVTFSDAQLAELRELLASAVDASDERLRIGQAIGRMYAIAGSQSPIHRDRGRNPLEERALEGAMDCIDHSSNTQTFLGILGDAGALRHHRPGRREMRFSLLIFDLHWTATIIEEGGAETFAVDSWFFAPGASAIVVTLARWKAGYDPEQESAGRR